MASNPKDFKATPWTHDGKVDKSGPSKPLVHNGTRPDVVVPTPMTHFKPTPHSGSGHKGLGNAGNANMGKPYPMSSDRSEIKSGMAMPPATKKSKPEVPADGKKWHHKGKYNMSVPATDAEGAAIAAKMKAS